ncbi:hypothetical protein [Avibacterium paragallinarum]|uniref:hypothetical protein n=1 Tax=Avibacterium paragallinarum TaxID=728 RepID=UPI00397E46CE
MPKETQLSDCQIGVVHTGDKIEVHQHFLSQLDRRKIIHHLLALKESDTSFFKLIQDICTAQHGSFMFAKLNDTDLKALFEIKTLVFSLYQEKEKHRLEVINLQQQLQKANAPFLRKVVEKLVGE